MCGIIGEINTEFNGSYLSLIEHRGPDDLGTYKYKNVELGQVRLSILDTTDAGHQPMNLEESGLTIVFNGEIYNHIELRKDLEEEGYQFYSSSDTETLLKGWDFWGEKVLNKLNGIFAFVILDEKKDTITVVRDQYGIKPLYIYSKGDQFAFSSEIKAFGQLSNFDDKVDLSSISQYISFLWSPGEQNPYKFVKKLLPGHYLQVPLSNPENYTHTQYHELPFKGNYVQDKSEEELVAELDKMLRNAVDRQLLSDVPLGFFLSGGLDSSLIVAIARDLYPNKKFNCFTIDSNMNESSEGFTDDLPFAKSVADYLNVDLHIVKANYNIIDQFDHMIWHLDEPQADPAPINVYNISKGARELGIKVLLGGTAGDDLFSGYRRHQALQYEDHLEKVPLFIRKGLQKSFSHMPSQKSFSRRLKKLSRDWDKTKEDRMLGYFNWLPNDPFVFTLFQDHLKEEVQKKSPYSYFHKILNEQDSHLTDLDKLLYLELKTFLPDHNLNYTDKMSMAAGVEARVPFLDNDVVDFAGKLPSEYKIKNGETKYLLKKVAEKYLPKKVIYRSKTGFGAPIRSWLKNELKPMVEERLNSDHLLNQGIFDPQAVQKMIDQNDKGEFDYSYTIWSMLAIQSWLKQFKWSL